MPGLIPAHAGKTEELTCGCVVAWAHPRSRGENWAAQPTQDEPPGSSPLTRGKPLRVRRADQHQGLIPAHAGKTEARRRARIWVRAHPRSRGENVQWPTNSITRMGSSPLTRGKRAVALSRRASTGLIPAHAGKTAVRLMLRRNRWAHPRSRGENYVITRDGGKPAGSSPLTRGKQGLHLAVSVSSGLIPAHAGKTRCGFGCHGGVPAHPRSRGENVSFKYPSRPIVGSSPLTRGKQGDGPFRLPERGLIPAHAGKTFRRRGSGPPPRAHPRSRGENRRGFVDRTGLWGLIPAHAGKTATRAKAPRRSAAHPRSRGENVRPAARGVAYDGSSPLTRGKPTPGIRRGVRTRLIPAHAGKTYDDARLPHECGAHPRSRGENSETAGSSSPGPGSSPLTRGKRYPRRNRRRTQGLIPAHAGKTLHRRNRLALLRAHPRSRGENPAPRVYPEWDDGSSPLTRGKLFSRSRRRSGSGLIPAHAGKTTWRPAWIAASWAHPRSRGENRRARRGS